MNTGHPLNVLRTPTAPLASVPNGPHPMFDLYVGSRERIALVSDA